MGTRLAILCSCSWCFVICNEGTSWTRLTVFRHMAQIVGIKSTCERVTKYPKLEYNIRHTQNTHCRGFVSAVTTEKVRMHM